MKTPTIFVLLFLLMVSPIAMAQEGDILGAIMEAAAAQENAGNQAQSEANSEAQSEAAAAWQEEWEKKKNANSDILDALDSKHEKCLALMALYLNEYWSIRDRTNGEQNCKMKYDLYGMELLLLTSSTTIMYCPEGLYESNNKAEIMKGFIDKFFNYEIANPEMAGMPGEYGSLQRTELAKKGTLSIKLAALIGRFGWEDHRWDTGTYRDFMEWLIKPFRPDWLTYRILVVGQKMEALGCGG